jgi:transcriptional regulator with XRE-family HTH domain
LKNLIREIRQRQEMQQKQLAALAEISQPYLHDLENGARGARPDTLQRIADALGVTVDELTEKAG